MSSWGTLIKGDRSVIADMERGMESKGESKSEGTYVRPLWPDDLVLDPGSSEEMPPEVEGIA